MVRMTNGDRTWDAGLRGDTNDSYVIRDHTASSNRLVIDSSGNTEIAGKLTFANDGLANGSIDLGADADLNLYHDNSDAFIDNNTGDFYIRNDGNSTSEKIRIQAKGGQEGIICTPNGSVDLHHSGSKKLETSSTGVSITGALVASGDVTAFSDAKLKTEISTINDALSTVGKLRGVSYKWLKDNKPSIGVIAQEVEKVIPEVVHTNQLDGEDVKSVDYGKLVGVLIEAIKELKAEVDELKGVK